MYLRCAELPALGYLGRWKVRSHICSALCKWQAGPAKDLMPNEPYDSPQKPFGGDEDFVWNPDGKHIVYVAKKKAGTEYALSTNTDLYEYDVETGTTRNLTEDNKGIRCKSRFQ
jgi:hypothetical protein